MPLAIGILQEHDPEAATAGSSVKGINIRVVIYGQFN